MAALVTTGWIAIVLQALPRPLVARLDAWSAARARRRAEARRARALSRRKAAQAAS